MNIENLKKLFTESDGELVVKNYKVFCEMLEIEPKKGNSKKAHLKEFDRHFRYEKQGNKMIVREVYEMALNKIENRGANGKYTDDLQEILLRLLSQSAKGEVLFSGNVLLKKLNMVNENYGVGRRNVPKLSELIDVDKDIIYDFYNTTNSNLLNSLETALKRLRSRRLIIWERVMVIAKVKAETNEFGEAKLNITDNTKKDATVQTSLIYRQATLEEKQIILDVEQSVLAQMGFKNTQQAFLGGMWTQYKQRVNTIVRDRLNIKFHFEGYLITFNCQDVKEALEDRDITGLRRMVVNNTVLQSVQDNAKTKHNNSINKKIEIDKFDGLLELYSAEELRKLGVKNGRLMAHDKIRMLDNFVDDTIKIANTVIDQGATNITSELSEDKVSKNTANDDNTNHTKNTNNDEEELPF